jgi:hypothetical protein
MPRYVYRGPSRSLWYDGKEYPRVRPGQPVGPGDAVEMSELEMINMSLQSNHHQFTALEDVPSSEKLRSSDEADRQRAADERARTRMTPPATEAVQPSVARSTEAPETPANP